MPALLNKRRCKFGARVVAAEEPQRAGIVMRYGTFVRIVRDAFTMMIKLRLRHVTADSLAGSDGHEQAPELVPIGQVGETTFGHPGADTVESRECQILLIVVGCAATMRRSVRRVSSTIDSKNRRQSSRAASSSAPFTWSIQNETDPSLSDPIAVLLPVRHKKRRGSPREGLNV